MGLQDKNKPEGPFLCSEITTFFYHLFFITY